MTNNATDAPHRGEGITLTGYLAGFGLALVLTLIPFGLVAVGWLSPPATLVVIALAAVVQIGVHLAFFLHLDFSPEQRWNTASAAFTFLILFTMVGGTLWLFYSLHFRMLPGG